jgi:PAS domain S-box-containing protein
MNSDEPISSSMHEELERLRARVLELEYRERQQERIEIALDECTRLATLTNEVSVALIQDSTLQASLQRCAKALVTYLGAAFARIWTLNTGTQVLELQASAGMYTHLNGPHSRVPVGMFKIGLIAAERQPHLTNAVIGDPRVGDQEWAKREGMVAFAGYPLLVEDELVGVMALFARVPLSTAVIDAMASISNAVALGIERKRVEEERTQLLLAEQQISAQAEAARSRLALILDNLTDGFMIFDDEWRYSYINPQAQPYTGKPWQDLLGKNVWEEFPELVGTLYYQKYHYAVLHQEPVAFEIFTASLSGWFDIHAYPIPGGLAVYFRDITERKHAEEERMRLLEVEQQAHAEAEAAKQQVVAILESITDAFFALDTQWHFTYLNAQSEPLLQHKREEMLGKNIWDEFPEAVDSTFYQQYHFALEQQKSVTFEEFYPPLETWFEVRAYPTPGGLSIYYHNISERKQAEEERLRLLKITETARNEAEAALQVRNDFLSSVSHDLKTPLAVMKGNMQLMQRRLKRGEVPDRGWLSDRLAVLESSIVKMNSMVETLLDVAKLQAGQKLDMDMRPIQLIPLIQQVITEQQETTRRHQIKVETPAEDVTIHGDLIRLDRVLTNLIGNAIKYSPTGGQIMVNIASEKGQSQPWVALSVCDQGVGIPATDQPHIFEPFYRAGNVTERIQGTGIGLASVAHVVHQHGGTISVSSEEGQGSTFVVRLPCAIQ